VQSTRQFGRGGVKKSSIKIRQHTVTADLAQLEAENSEGRRPQGEEFPQSVFLNLHWLTSKQTAFASSLKTLVSAAGFEPATHALKGHCSTN
jgi:hypothetical protein